MSRTAAITLFLEVVGGLLGEGEMMAESEFEGEGEPEGEGFLGDVVGGLLGESELEGEQFFGTVFKTRSASTDSQISKRRCRAGEREGPG
jgi:hypothetical protein